jgi:membrane-associated HD superfamily phosphohydrolase
MSLGIIYLIYNFFKVTAIVINILINNNNLNIWPSVVDEEIKKELDVKKKKKNKTEKQNKKLSSNNDYSNNYYQSTKISKNLFDSTFIQDSPSKLQ